MAKKKSGRRDPYDDDFLDAAGDDEDEFTVSDTRSRAAGGAKKKKSQAAEDDVAEYFGAEFAAPEPPDAGKAKSKKGKGVKGDKGGDSQAGRRRVINMDVRKMVKLTKKAQASLAVWKGSNRARAVDQFFVDRAVNARKKFGHRSVFVGAESDSLIVGIPMFGGNDANAVSFPGCLPLEFVIAQDVFPLGLVMQIVALTGVGKSAILAEIGRWFALAGGGFVLEENETKFNWKWYESILREFAGAVVLDRCMSVEDWQRGLSFFVNDMKAAMEGTREEPGPGRTFPVLFGVDSIMGKMSEETQEKIFGKRTADGGRGKTGVGHAERGWAVEALKITRYMRSIPQELDNWPFSLVLINHLRRHKNDDGIEVRQKSGGEQVNFQESFELELIKHGGPKKKIECTEWEGYPVRITCEKNSFGPTGRSVVTRLLWWEEEDDKGNWRQRTVWDWDWSTVWLLNNVIRGEKANPRLRAALKKIDFHLECPSVSDVENRAWSRTLGMTQKDPASWAEVGAMIRQDQALLDRLRAALRINRRPLLEGDYLEQLDSLTEYLP